MFIINLINSTLTVILVIAGGLISMMHVIILLTLGYIFTPINIYFGLYSACNFSGKSLSRFWATLVIFALPLIIAINYNMVIIQALIFTGFSLFMLYELRSSVEGVLMFLYNKISKYKRHS